MLTSCSVALQETHEEFYWEPVNKAIGNVGHFL